jgi:hypothetical protein
MTTRPAHFLLQSSYGLLHSRLAKTILSAFHAPNYVLAFLFWACLGLTKVGAMACGGLKLEATQRHDLASYLVVQF